MKIRKFQPNDSIKASNTIKKAIDHMVCYPKYIREDLKTRYNSKGLKDFAKRWKLYVIEDDGKILGTGALDKNIVYCVYINPSMHRKGLGTKMMDYLEKVTRKNYGYIETHASPNAYPFYKKLGYKKIKNKNNEKGLVVSVIARKKF